MINIKKTIQVVKSVLLLSALTFCLAGCGGTPDGEYTASVSLEGGSGKAYIESPCRVTIKNGKTTADLIWSSPNYDYMIVDGNTYYPVNSEGNSEFVIPVRLDEDMEISADTTAMSTPHLIDYTLRVSLTDEPGESDLGDTGSFTKADVRTAPVIPGIEYTETVGNRYATGFAIHRYSEGYTVISVEDGRQYLLVPEGKDRPEGIEKDMTVLYLPLDRIYLAASGAMCHFDELGAVENIMLSGLKSDDWYIDSARSAMEEGTLSYGGKYSAPDYEKILLNDTDIAIENTMILHVPKVQEKLEQLGVPVFIDRANYEAEPLGRCEWIKVYGALCGRQVKAQEAFDAQCDLVEAVRQKTQTGRSVAYFYVNSNHQIVTRKKNDYFAKMVTMAGGTYLAPDMGDDDGGGQTTVSIEAFYEYARSADILIYNASVTGAPDSLERLCSENESLKDFKAVSERSVWYTDKSLYQYTDRTGTIIENLNKVIADDEDDSEFFHRLR